MDDAWACSAAYGYVVHLAPALRAWEYLRRNPRYVRDWVRYRRRASPRIAARWGLAALVDPHLDARQVLPVWAVGPACPVTLVRDETARAGSGPEAAERFSLWRLSDHSSLFQDSGGLRLTVCCAAKCMQLRLSSRLSEGDRFAYLIPAATADRAGWIALTGFRALTLVSGDNGVPLRERPGRADIFHVRALQVLDGLAAGATQRELAIALFGAIAVARGWQPDSALRAQMRYFIRRARALMAGEYRSMVVADRRLPGSPEGLGTGGIPHE